MTGFQIVVVEDGAEMAASIAEMLARRGYQASLAEDAETGLELARSLPADLVLLDVTLPGIDGFEACRRLRQFSDAYVIMLSGRAGKADRLAGLAAGADDYVTKPFYPAELLARVEAMRRRPRSVAGLPITRFGELSIDAEAQRVTVGATPVFLSQTEYRLLSVLAANPSRAVSREELLGRVWGEDWVGGDDHLIDVHVSNLRRKLGDDGREPIYVETVRGVGFRMGTG